MDLRHSLKRKLPGLPPAKRPPGRFRNQHGENCTRLANEDSASSEISSIALPSNIEKVSTPSVPIRTGENTKRMKTSNLSKIPAIFKRLCYFNFSNVCTNPPYTCNRMHFVAESMMQKIETLEGDELIDAYKFAKEKPKLLQYTVLSFLNAFSRKSDVAQLIRCVDDILKINFCDKTPFIDKILLHLLHIGLSFRAAVNEIIEVHGNQKMGLSDIILDIIVFQHKEDVYKNWELVQKLLKDRTEPIDHGIIEEIMTICCKTNSTHRIHFIKKVFDDIIKSDAVNFNMINNSILMNFIVMLTSLNLEEEKRVLFNRMEIYRNSDSSIANMGNIDFRTSILKNGSKTEKLQDTDPRIHNSPENHRATVNLQNTDLRIGMVPQNCSLSVNRQNTDLCVDNIPEKNSSRVNLQDNDLHINNAPQYGSSRVGLQDVDLHRDKMIKNSSSTVKLQHMDLCEENVISNTDLLKLRDYVHQRNDVSFIFLLSSFKNDSIDKQRLLVVKTLAYFKEETLEKVCTFMYSVLNGIERLHPSYMNDVGINNMLSMLAINVIGLLEDKKLYKNASEILLKFYMHLESIKNTIWLTHFHRHNYSECGKFLYFCKIFIKGLRVKEAWKILTLPELRLMHKVDMWTLHRKDPFDDLFRNFVLEDLISVSLLVDPKFAKVVILNVLQHKNLMATKIDVWKHFNKLLLNMLKSSEMYMEDLKSLLKYILGGWYKNLEKRVMRSLLICLTSKISKIDAMKLYNKCCKQNYYPHLQGNEDNLTLNSDMLLEEIDMTINTYLYKKAKKNYELTDLMVFINLHNATTTTNVPQPKMLPHVERMIKIMKKNICSVLAGGDSHISAVNYAKTKDPFILIEAKDLENIYRHYQKNNGTRNRR